MAIVIVQVEIIHEPWLKGHSEIYCLPQSTSAEEKKKKKDDDVQRIIIAVLDRFLVVE